MDSFYQGYKKSFSGIIYNGFMYVSLNFKLEMK